LISLFISRRIRRPLDEIRRRAEAIGQGNLSERVSSSDMLEIDVLATTINHMADELNERISMITQQRDEENALLACMMESVIAVDVEKRVLKMNQSAQVLFGVNASVCGKNVMEIIRNNDLRDIIARALASSEPVEGSVSLPDDGRYLLAHGTTLKGVAGQRIGALVVLNDVTRLHRLEMMRRDFVADVSHELKTPITSIKGFVETLLDEGGKDSEQTKGFLRIVAKQTDRLMAIIEDLLMLSRLEQEDYRRDLPLEEALLKDVVESAIEVCRHKAREKQIEVKPSCASGLRARINAALFEQAIVNLVDNAIKYSPSGSVVRVDTKEDGGEVVLQVRDNGSGIEKEHLPRLFERFYRVDKGRSRQLGGTGLGLAIVKHIVLAHHGRVDVESVLGKGSVFTIVLPQV
jgi:two-component system phosphate regulon sensor histidine kinase PhoR